MDLAGKVAPTEEVIKALLDYFVAPMLPLKATGKDPPLATPEAVAKQVSITKILINLGLIYSYLEIWKLIAIAYSYCTE